MSVPKKIAFYAGAAIPIHARTLDERPLGGTETGVLRLAERLEQCGAEVTVFTSLPDPPASKPRFLHFSKLADAGEFDLLVLVQEWKGLFFRLPAKRVWFWTGDGPEIYSTFGIGDRRVRERLELLLAVSEYHKNALAIASGFPREKIVVLGNGVHLPYFEGSEDRNPQRLIFTSAPYRGLEHVAPLLAELRSSHPSLEFHAFSGMNLYDREQPFQGPHVAQYRRIAELLSRIPGVTLHGNVLQSRLAREYLRSAVYFYPCTVPETCCITALEAQAAGCALVTSALGALPETVSGSGFSIPGQVGSPSFNRQFIDATRALLDDHALWQRCSAFGRSRNDLGWDTIAERFLQLLAR